MLSDEVAGSPEGGAMWVRSSCRKLAEKLDVPDEAVVEMEQRMGSKDLSLDAELTDEKDASHLDFLSGGDASQEEILTKAEEEERVRSGMAVALKTLKDRERYIIEKRVLADKPLTLEELGSKFNISRERVRQIESAALKKIKDVLEEKGIGK